MSTYCCCGQKVKPGWECMCKWDGWVDLRKEDILPQKDGVYSVRYYGNDGGSGERLMKFTKRPIRFENDGKCPIHWDRSHYDDNIVYAWQHLI